MRLKSGIAYAALGLASVGVIGAGIETFHGAQDPTPEEIVHADIADGLKEQIDHLLPGTPSSVHDDLRKKQIHELIAVSTSEWERDNIEILGLLVSCAGASALILGGAKIYIDDKR